MERSKRAVLMDLELLAVVCEKTADIRGRLPDGSPELGLLESVSASAHQGTAFADSVRGLHNYFISRGDVRGLYGFVREGTYDCEPHSCGLRPAGVP